MAKAMRWTSSHFGCRSGPTSLLFQSAGCPVTLRTVAFQVPEELGKPVDAVVLVDGQALEADGVAVAAAPGTVVLLPRHRRLVRELGVGEHAEWRRVVAREVGGELVEVFSVDAAGRGEGFVLRIDHRPGAVVVTYDEVRVEPSESVIAVAAVEQVSAIEAGSVGDRVSSEGASCAVDDEELPQFGDVEEESFYALAGGA